MSWNANRHLPDDLRKRVESGAPNIWDDEPEMEDADELVDFLRPLEPSKEGEQ